MPNGLQHLECEVEIAPIANDLKLSMRCVISEDEAAAVPANRIVFGREKYYAHVFWKLTGMLKHHFCGEWNVQIHFESVGVGDEYSSPVAKIAMDPCKEDEYYHRFTLEPDVLRPQEGGTVYLPAVTLSTKDACGGDGHIWGYCTGPSVMFTLAMPED